jgi:hypothetical protein
VHGRADQSACQGELMMSSEIFFAGFELLTFVLKGAARSAGESMLIGGDLGKRGWPSGVHLSRHAQDGCCSGRIFGFERSNSELCQKIRRMDRFREQIEVVVICASPFQKICGGGLAREKQDFAFWVRFTEVNCQFNAGHTRHHDITNEESRSQLGACGDSLLRIIECTCLKPAWLRIMASVLGDHGFIVNDEDHTICILHLVSLISVSRILLQIVDFGDLFPVPPQVSVQCFQRLDRDHSDLRFQENWGGTKTD